MNSTSREFALVLACLAWLSVVLGRSAIAQTPAGDVSSPAEAAQRERWQQVYKSIANSITMRRGDKPLALLDSSLLFYTNPVRTNDQHGAIFLWTENGRPAVIGSIWSSINRQNPSVRFVTHEWHSLLADKDVNAIRGEQPLWTSGEVGVVWEPLAGAPTPAETRAARLVQMRAIARRYSVAIEVADESDLRLMEQPLYRYPEEVRGAIDGAIFAFAMTTDPELLLLMEDRETAGKPAWHIAFARFGNKAMKVSDGEKTVWSCEQGAPGRSDGKYYLRWRADEMPTAPSPTPQP